MKHEIYLIRKKGTGNFVRYGETGSGELGWCLNRGHIAAFESEYSANLALSTFSQPENFSIVKFSQD